MALVKETWHTFTKTWDTTVRLSAWYVLIAVGSALAAFMKNGQAGSEFLASIIQLATAIGSIYLSVKIYKMVFQLEDQKPLASTPSRETWRIAAMILLSAIVIMVPLFLGIGIAILPFIFASKYPVGIGLGILLVAALVAAVIYLLAVRFSFAQTHIIDQTKTIKEAFMYSWKITKDRFWAILGRTILGGIIFGLFVGALCIAAIFIVSLVSGVDIASEMAKQNPSPSVKSISELIQGIIMAGVIPLFYIFKVKLYRNVEKSVA